MTNFARQRLLLLLSPRQKQELVLYRYITEVAPSGRVFRLHLRKSAQTELRTGTGPFSRRRVVLCVVPESYSYACTTRAAKDRWGRSRVTYDGVETLWTITRYDVVAGLLAAIRCGDEARLFSAAFYCHSRPWGIGLTEEEKSLQTDYSMRGLY